MRKDFENYSGSFYLEKDWIFPYSEIAKGSKIVLYGAGDVGQAYYDQVCYTNYCIVVHWMDKNFLKYKETGLPVEDPDMTRRSAYEYVLIAVADAATARKINAEEVLRGVPQEKIVWIGNERKALKPSYESRILEPLRMRKSEILKHRNIEDGSEEANRLVRKINEKDKGMILPRIVVQISSVCTMHCRKCNNLMPLYHNFTCHPSHCPKAEIIRDIDILMGNIDKLLTMELIGGEPFSHPDFFDILKYILSLNNIIEVEITTNGTIVPSKDILNELKNQKVYVKISDYQQDKTDLLEAAFLDSGIRYEMNRDLTWIDSGGVEKRNKSKTELRRVYALCGASYNCKTLYNGRLYACARAANLYNLGICTEEEGYVDLRKGKNLRRDILDFFKKQDDPSCDYCDYVETWRQIPAGEQ